MRISGGGDDRRRIGLFGVDERLGGGLVGDDILNYCLNVHVAYQFLSTAQKTYEIVATMENECQYVSSRGIMKSCKRYNPVIQSGNAELPDNFLDDIQPYDSVYVCTAALPLFVEKFLPNLTKCIILVSGDSTYSVAKRNATKPNMVTNSVWKPIVKSRYIKHWYAQNCTFSHRRIAHIPLGLDYHSSGWGVGTLRPIEQEAVIKSVLMTCIPFHLRQIKCYSSYHFTLKRGDRMDAFTKVNTDLVFYEPKKVSRHESHQTQSKYAFVISPFGKGVDCHRTWEALILGCIPIMRHSGLDPLFFGLPVLFVNDWSEVTQELLNHTVETYKKTIFNYDKLRLSYWTTRFH